MSPESRQLEQGMRQSMVVGASMQLFLRALQASQTELAQMATHALNSNPALEELPPPLAQEDEDDRPTPDFEAAKRHDALVEALPQQTTLSGYLEEQVLQSGLPRVVERDAIALIARMDTHGFFVEDPETLGIPPVRLREALRVVQDLEPAGVGARDLRESLLLQLRRRGEEKSLSYRLVNECWEDLTRHRFPQAARTLGVNENTLNAAVHRISRLNPDPGSSFSAVEQPIGAPDVVVLRHGTELTVRLTGEMVPHLTLSAQYREMLAEQGDQAELRRYLSQCFREGRELIRAIEKRQETILAIARAIVKRQRDFFLRGPSCLHPLRMDEVAEVTQMHTSTVSRAVNGKYLRCEYGVYELRSFFTGGVPTTSGEQQTSGASVKAQIRALIEAEDASAPLSDAALEKLLTQRGLKIARRTIAKYRDQLRILPATLRKRSG